MIISHDSVVDKAVLGGSCLRFPCGSGQMLLAGATSSEGSTGMGT